MERTAAAFGIGVATVKRIMSDYNRDPDLLHAANRVRGRPGHSVSETLQGCVRAYIREANQRGDHITLDDIHTFPEVHYPGESFHRTTLSRTLNRWGFEFGKGTRSQHLKEKDHVIAARQHYLREMKNNRLSKQSLKTRRPEVYWDESSECCINLISRQQSVVSLLIFDQLHSEAQTHLSISDGYPLHVAADLHTNRTLCDSMASRTPSLTGEC